MFDRRPSARASVAALLLTMAGPTWSAAQDDAPSRDDRLTLAETYAQARARNPRLAAASSFADAKAAMVPSAGLPPDPFFRIGAMNLSLPDFDADMESSMLPALELMQMIPFPGKLGLSERIAERTSEIARFDADEAWWEVRTDVAASFYELYAADRQLEVMRRTLRLLENYEQVARAMYGAGTGRQSDVLRANVEIARMEAGIARMEAERHVAAARLNGLLDRPAEAPVPTPTLPALPASVPPPDTLRAWAEETRPMLAGAKTGVERARAGRALARRELWPDFTVGLGYGQRDLGMGTERMASAMVGFTIPIFAPSRQLRMRDEAAAMERMAEAELADARAQVGARIGGLLADLERAQTLIALYENRVLPQAEANVESSFSSYRVGSVDFMTLVDAQMTVNGYEQEYHALLAQYGTAVAEIEMTVGRELPLTPELLAEVR